MPEEVENKEVEDDYRKALLDLKVNSKPLITMLTMLAEESKEYAPNIVKVLSSHIQETNHRLPAMYLIDSIVKNVGTEYKKLINTVLVQLFSTVFKNADEKTRKKLYELRQTWNEVFPQSRLYLLDVTINEVDPAWPITSQSRVPQPSPTIHINPKKLKQVSPSLQPTSVAAHSSSTSTMASSAGASSSDLEALRKLQHERRVLEQKRKTVELQMKQEAKSGEASEKGSNIHVAPWKAKQILPPQHDAGKEIHSSLIQTSSASFSSRDPRLNQSSTKTLLKPAPMSRDPRLVNKSHSSSTVPSNNRPKSGTVSNLRTESHLALQESKKSHHSPHSKSDAKAFSSISSHEKAKSMYSRIKEAQSVRKSKEREQEKFPKDKKDSHQIERVTKKSPSPTKKSVSYVPEKVSLKDSEKHRNKSREREKEKALDTNKPQQEKPKEKEKEKSKEKEKNKKLKETELKIKVKPVSLKTHEKKVDSNLDKIKDKKDEDTKEDSHKDCTPTLKESDNKDAKETLPESQHQPQIPERSSNKSKSPIKDLTSSKEKEFKSKEKHKVNDKGKLNEKNKEKIKESTPQESSIKEVVKRSLQILQERSEVSDVATSKHPPPSQKSPIQTGQITVPKETDEAKDACESDDSDHYDGNRPPPINANHSHRKEETVPEVSPMPLQTSGDVDLRHLTASKLITPISKEKIVPGPFAGLFGSEDVDLRRLAPPPTSFATQPTVPTLGLNASKTPHDLRESTQPHEIKKDLDERFENSFNREAIKTRTDKTYSQADQVQSPIETQARDSHFDDVFAVEPLQGTPAKNQAISDLQSRRTSFNSPNAASWEKFRDKNPKFREYQRQASMTDALQEMFERENLSQPPTINLKEDQYRDKDDRGKWIAGSSTSPRHAVSDNFDANRSSRGKSHPYSRKNRFEHQTFARRGRVHQDRGKDITWEDYRTGEEDLPNIPEETLRAINRINETREIDIDMVPRQIRVYGEKAFILLDWDDPRPISFEMMQCNIVFDGGKLVVPMVIGQDYKEFVLDGKKHKVKLGVPSQELLIDGKGYQCFFGGKSIGIFLGGKNRTVLLDGRPPQVDIGLEKNTDYLAGKIDLDIHPKKNIKLFLDAKPQSFYLDGKAFFVKFVDKFKDVIINGERYPVDFGGPPLRISVRDRCRYFSFSNLPPGVIQGVTSVKGMASDGSSLFPDYPLTPPHVTSNFSNFSLGNDFNPPPAMSQHSANNFPNVHMGHPPLRPLRSQVPRTSGSVTPGAYLSGGTRFVPPIDTSLPPPLLPPFPGSSRMPPMQSAPVVPSQPPPPQLDITSLLENLAKSGLIKDKPKGPTEKEVAEESEIDDLKDFPSVPDMFELENLRKRRPKMILRLYRGFQCSSCGLRFLSDKTAQYSHHLDWHFRMNKKEQDSSKKPNSRKYYHCIDDWIQYEELEDLDERVPSMFEQDVNAQDKSQDQEEEEIPSVAVSSDNILGVCPICHETFDQFYHHTTEEWHYKYAILIDGINYHPGCHQDLINRNKQEEERKQKEEEEEKKRKEEEEEEAKRKKEEQKEAEEKKLKEDKEKKQKEEEEKKQKEEEKKLREAEEKKLREAEEKKQKEAEEKEQKEAEEKEQKEAEEKEQSKEVSAKVTVEENPSKDSEDNKESKEMESEEVILEESDKSKEEEEIEELQKEPKVYETINIDDEDEDERKSRENEDNEYSSQSYSTDSERSNSDDESSSSQGSDTNKPNENGLANDEGYVPVRIKEETVEGGQTEMRIYVPKPIPPILADIPIKMELPDEEEQTPTFEVEDDEPIAPEQNEDDHPTSWLAPIPSSTTDTDIAISIDGNTEFLSTPENSQQAPAAPRIKISVTVPSKVSTENENKVPEWNGTAVVSSSEENLFEEFIPPPFTVDLSKKPAFKDVDLINQPAEHRGAEISSLCSIM